jgi:hypothetical protein
VFVCFVDIGGIVDHQYLINIREYRKGKSKQDNPEKLADIMLAGRLFEEEQTFVRLYSQVQIVVRGKETFFLFGLINALFNIGFSFVN